MKRVKKIIKKCLFCQLTFEVLPCYFSRVYCSHNCFLKSGNCHRGKKHTDKTKLKISLKKKLNPTKTQFKNGHKFISGGEKGWFKKGQKPKNWLGGKRSLSQKIKDDVRWKKWRKLVFERDKYTCQKCGQKGGYLEPHHIKEKTNFPELSFNIDNGVTLCKECHKLTNNYGGKTKSKNLFTKHF